MANSRNERGISVLGNQEMIELPDGNRALYLGQYDQCFITGESNEQTLPRIRLETEHIIPNLAARQHKRLLGNVVNMHVNHAHVCHGCHHRIDRAKDAKMDSYRTKGVTGLIEWVGVYYPRAEDEHFFTIQHLQWQLLFRKIQDGFRAFKGEFPKPHESDYSKGQDLVAFHLEQWERGRFR